jgi:hypothetical protein
MVVAKKPKAKTSEQPQGVDVDALIRKGGSVAGETGDKEADAGGKTTSVILRIPGDVMNRIDEAVRGRRIKTPRHTWFLEAVMEKLDREDGEG